MKQLLSENIIYIQTCIIGLGILLVPLSNSSSRNSKDWRMFQGILFVVMADMFFETGTWLINGRFFPHAYEVLYWTNLMTILLQSVMALLWLLFTMEKLRIPMPKVKIFHIFCLLPFLTNLGLLLTSRTTGAVFFIDERHLFNRGWLFWLEVLLTFLYPLAATVVALRSALRAQSEEQRRNSLILASFMVVPIIAAVLQLIFYGTFLFLIGFAFSLLIVFVNMQNEQITIDYLTKLNNRSSFIYYFEHKMRNVRPPSRLFLYMIDVNHFKHVNDTYGHVVGDEVLRAVAGQLKIACNHQRCFLARLGGDEFSILLECEEEQETERLRETIHACLDAYNQTEKFREPLSVSIGCAECDPENDTVDRAVKRADEKMYLEKRRIQQAAEDAR